ncbi:MAG: hypothetical protein A2V67_12155 [Deltaproteobacteria bacterium RBG_13_61_14]|nr:MAG: hypothetical protein A2V67_12155 [Deltaproteobacteria bacterium RBG_13_61_14]
MNPAPEKKPISCPLCGQRFVPEASRCANCPLAGQGCERICCPNCSYSFPEESRLVSWLRRHFSGRPEVSGEEKKP